MTGGREISCGNNVNEFRDNIGQSADTTRERALPALPTGWCSTSKAASKFSSHSGMSRVFATIWEGGAIERIMELTHLVHMTFGHLERNRLTDPVMQFVWQPASDDMSISHSDVAPPPRSRAH